MRAIRNVSFACLLALFTFGSTDSVFCSACKVTWTACAGDPPQAMAAAASMQGYSKDWACATLQVGGLCSNYTKAEQPGNVEGCGGNFEQYEEDPEDPCYGAIKITCSEIACKLPEPD